MSSVIRCSASCPSFLDALVECKYSLKLQWGTAAGTPMSSVDRSGSVLDVNMLDEANPSAFYLDDEELVKLADSIWVVGSHELPVHSGVVVQRSQVLRDAYLTQADSGLLAVGRVCCPKEGGCQAPCALRTCCLCRPAVQKTKFYDQYGSLCCPLIDCRKPC